MSEQEPEPEMTDDELAAEPPATVDEAEEALSIADNLGEEPDGGDQEDGSEIDPDEEEEDDPDDDPDQPTLERTAKGK